MRALWLAAALHVAFYELPQQQHKMWMWVGKGAVEDESRHWMTKKKMKKVPHCLLLPSSLPLPPYLFTAVNDNTLSICWIPFGTCKFQLHLSQKEIIKVVAGFQSQLKSQHVTMGRKCVFHSTFRGSSFIQTAHSFIHSYVIRVLGSSWLKMKIQIEFGWKERERIPQQFQLKGICHSYLSISPSLFFLPFCQSLFHS